MPVSANFTADFSSFNSAVEQAQTKLITFQTNANKVPDALGRIERSLSGQKLIQDATLMAEAVQRIGGVSKLTANQLQQLGAQAQEATAKMRAMGIGVPAHLQEIADAAKSAGTSMDFFKSTFGGVFSGMAAANLLSSVGRGIKDFAADILDTAGQLSDLKAKTGLSTDTLQEMGFVAKQSGTDMQTMADAAFKMGVTIQEGTGKARKAAQDLGLDWQALRAASPDDQFHMVVEALEKMEDPQRRNAAAVALFGKAAKEILAAVAQGYSEVGKQATKSGDAQIAALDKAGDKWDEFKDHAKNAAAGAAGSWVIAGEKITGGDSWMNRLLSFMVAGIPGGIDALAKFQIAAQNAHKDVNLPVDKGIASADFTDQLREAADTMLRLTESEKAQIKSALDLGKSNDDIINGMPELISGLTLTDDTLNLLKKTWQENAAAEQKAHQQEMKDIEERNKAWAKSAADQQKLMNNIVAAQAKLGATANEQEKANLTKQLNDDIAAARARTDVTADQTARTVELLKIQYKQAIEQVGLDLTTINTKTYAQQQELADNALKTYNEMLGNSGAYSREVLDAQLQKYRDLQQAANDYFRGGTAAQDGVAGATRRTNAALDDQLASLKRIEAFEAEAAAAAEARNVTVTQDLTDPEVRARIKAQGPPTGANLSQLQQWSLLMAAIDKIEHEQATQSGSAALAESKPPKPAPPTVSASSTPAGLGTGTVTINVSGVWDSRSKEELAAAVQGVINTQTASTRTRTW